MAGRVLYRDYDLEHSTCHKIQLTRKALLLLHEDEILSQKIRLKIGKELDSGTPKKLASYLEYTGKFIKNVLTLTP